VASGVRNLLLVGRRGMETPGFAEALPGLRQAGATVHAAAADVGDKRAMRLAIAEASKTMPPICGVIHGAMVLDDGIIRNLSPARLAAVLRPKIDGAWILHRLTRDLPLTHFVVFSSVASLIGNPGQAAYVAANTFLESLIATRRALGLPGTALCWGPIADTGVFARAMGPGGRQPLERAFQPMTSAESLTHLGAALRCGVDHLGVFRADWTAMPGLRLGRLRALLPESAEGAKGGDFSTQLAEATGAQLSALIEDRLAASLSRILGLGATGLDRLKPVGNLGLDSLMAVELGHVLETDLGIPVPMMKLMQNRTTEDMARELATMVENHRRKAA
jgi:acyl carrier protein